MASLAEKPRFFKSAGEFRGWLEDRHGKADHLLIGFHKKHSGLASITYPEALDLALCYGWIDGVRKAIDANSYTIRFSRRRAKSIWSLVNIKRVHELKRLGLMQASGLKAFGQRDEQKAAQYSYERKTRELGPAEEKRFKANAKAWAFFQSQTPSQRRLASWYVMSAKREETRLKRLATVIDASRKGLRLADVMRKA